jgi:hypothetical protein
MLADLPLEQTLRAELGAFYEALRWGGMELEVHTERLQHTLQWLDAMLTRAEPPQAGESNHQRQSRERLMALQQRAQRALRMAQEMNLLEQPASLAGAYSAST